MSHKAIWRGSTRAIPDLGITVEAGDEFEIPEGTVLGGEGPLFDIVGGDAFDVAVAEAKDLGIKGATKLTLQALTQLIDEATTDHAAETEGTDV